MSEEGSQSSPRPAMQPNHQQTFGNVDHPLWRSTATPEGYVWRELQLPSFPYVAQVPSQSNPSLQLPHTHVISRRQSRWSTSPAQISLARLVAGL